MQIEMSIKGLMIDPITNMPIIVLRDQEGQRLVPIWVGVFEANAIALQIENVATPRPMTHDLLRNVIADLEGTVERIVVCDLRENTFYATIHIRLPPAARCLPAQRRTPSAKTTLPPPRRQVDDGRPRRLVRPTRCWDPPA